MRTIKEVRRDNVQSLINERHGGTRIRFSEVTGIRTGYVTRILNVASPSPRGIGEAKARLIERAYDLQNGALDWPDMTNQQAPKSLAELMLGAAPLDGLITRTSGGAFERVGSNRGADSKAARATDVSPFTLAVEGDGLWPWAQHGTHISFEPGANPSPGDAVYIQTATGEERISRLVWITRDELQVVDLTDRDAAPMTMKRADLKAIYRAAGQFTPTRASQPN